MVAKKKVESLSSWLKKQLGENRFENDYAILSHYLSLQDSPSANFYANTLRSHNVDFTKFPKKETYLKQFSHYAPIKNPTFTFIDLFAGIGGFRLAMQRNGGECVFSSEWDESAQKTYSTNYAEYPFGDITKINSSDIPDFDVLTGGFPCQPFSSIGKREGFEHKTQGTLFFYIAKIIKEKKPKAFLLENVPGLISHNNGKTLGIILDVIRQELKYDVSIKILNSANFGVPQERKRLYFVGFRKNLGVKNFEFPKENNKKVGIGKFIEVDADGPSISEHLQQSYIFKKNDGHPEIIDKNSDFPVKTLCASYHKIQRITGTFVRGGKTGLRLLTEQECKAIMGFPPNFTIPVSRTQMYHQFGNSVATPVVQKISEQIIKFLQGLV